MTSSLLPQGVLRGSPIMMFVDGENLAIRYRETLGDRAPESHIVYERDIFMWSRFLNLGPHYSVIRRHYYTSAVSDEEKRISLEERLRATGIEYPRVFPPNQGPSLETRRYQPNDRHVVTCSSAKL